MYINSKQVYLSNKCGAKAHSEHESVEESKNKWWKTLQVSTKKNIKKKED